MPWPEQSPAQAGRMKTHHQVSLPERDSDRGTHLEQLCCVSELKGHWEAAPRQSEDGGADLFILVSNNNPA